MTSLFVEEIIAEGLAAIHAGSTSVALVALNLIDRHAPTMAEPIRKWAAAGLAAELNGSTVEQLFGEAS